MFWIIMILIGSFVINLRGATYYNDGCPAYEEQSANIIACVVAGLLGGLVKVSCTDVHTSSGDLKYCGAIVAMGLVSFLTLPLWLRVFKRRLR